MPVMFVGHGSPMNAVEDNEYTKEWKTLGEQYQPQNIMIFYFIYLEWQVRKSLSLINQLSLEVFP